MSKKDYSFIHHHLWVGALLCMCLLCQLSLKVERPLSVLIVQH